jgi:preprotein translocase subunit YajC
LYSLILLAQEAAPEKGTEPGPGGLSFFFPIILMFVVFYLLIIVPGRKERQNRQAMLGALKKNDKIITQGGIIGVVTSLKEGTDEMVIKSEDTKLLVLKSSVARVITEGEKETPKEPPKEASTKP